MAHHPQDDLLIAIALCEFSVHNEDAEPALAQSLAESELLSLDDRSRPEERPLVDEVLAMDVGGKLVLCPVAPNCRAVAVTGVLAELVATDAGRGVSPTKAARRRQ